MSYRSYKNLMNIFLLLVSGFVMEQWKIHENVDIIIVFVD